MALKTHYNMETVAMLYSMVILTQLLDPDWKLPLVIQHFAVKGSAKNEKKKQKHFCDNLNQLKLSQLIIFGDN